MFSICISYQNRPRRTYQFRDGFAYIGVLFRFVSFSYSLKFRIYTGTLFLFFGFKTASRDGCIIKHRHPIHRHCFLVRLSRAATTSLSRKHEVQCRKVFYRRSSFTRKHPVEWHKNLRGVEILGCPNLCRHRSEKPHRRRETRANCVETLMFISMISTLGRGGESETDVYFRDDFGVKCRGTVLY